MFSACRGKATEHTVANYTRSLQLHEWRLILGQIETLKARKTVTEDKEKAADVNETAKIQS